MNFRNLIQTTARFCKIHQHLLCVLTILLAVWLAYGKCLNYDFVWDDYGLIVNNPLVRSPSQWHESFFRSFWRVGENVQDPTRNFYRPLISISYMTDYSLGKLNPRAFHVTNLLAHGICACLVYMLGIHMLKRPIPVLLGSIIWAIHPIHVENVCWISGRTDIFCAIFFLLAFYSFWCWANDPAHYPYSPFFIALCYLFALFSKETAVALPLLMLVCYTLPERERPPWRPFVLLLAFLATITGWYLCVRLSVLGSVLGPSHAGNLLQVLGSIPMIFCEYLRLSLGVMPVDPHHSEGFIRDVLSHGNVARVLISIGYFVGIFWCLQHRKLLLVFLLFWMPITLLPVFYLGGFGDVLYADRFLYVPSFGIVFAVVAMLSSDKVRLSGLWVTRLITVIAVGFIVLLLILSRINSSYWQNNLVLFHRALRTSPRSAYVHFNLGNSLLATGAYEKASEAYEKVVSLLPSFARAHANLGVCLNRLGRYEDAIKAFREAVKHGDHSYILYSNLGNSYRRLGHFASAIRCYQISLGIRPKEADPKATASVHNNLGECFLASGAVEPAYESLTKALALHPSAVIYNNLGLLFMQKKDYGQALRVLNKAVKLPDKDVSPRMRVRMHYNLAISYCGANDIESGKVHAGKALELMTEMEFSSEADKTLSAWLKAMVETE